MFRRRTPISCFGQTERVRNQLALAVLLAVTACSAGSADSTEQALDSPTATPSVVATTTPSASAKPLVPGGTDGNAVASATAGTSTSRPASSAPIAPLSTKAPGTVAAQKATSPGVYTLDEKGTVTLGDPGTPQDAAGTTTLTVDPLTNGVQHSTLHSDSTGDTEQDLLVRSTGTYLAALTLTSPAFTKEFRPAPAVLLIPDPATTGTAWSWKAISTDGKTTAVATNKVTGTQTLTIGGTKVLCTVVQTRLVLSGDVDYATDLTTHWSPEHRLAVKTHSTGKGSYNGFPFTTDITSTMRSVKPA